MNNKIPLLIIGALVIVGAAFYGGTLWEGGAFASLAGAPVPGQAQFGTVSPPTSTLGQVVAVNGTEVAIKLQDGSTKTVLIGTSTSITQVVSPQQRTLNDLKPGLVISAMYAPGGSAAGPAQSINIMPPPPAK